MKRVRRPLYGVLALVLLIVSAAALAEGTGPEPSAEPAATAAPNTVTGPANIAGTITNDCSLILPEKKADKGYRLLDAYVESYLPLIKGESILINMPSAAQGLYLEWYEQSLGHTIEELDAEGGVTCTHEAQPYVNAYYELDESTRAIRILASENCALSSLRLYGPDAPLPDSVQRWQAPRERADMVFLAATPEAALEDLFAALTIYAVEHEMETALICMSADTRSAQNDLLDALWALGIQSYPYFGGFFTWNNASYLMVSAEWKAIEAYKYIESTLAALSPRVIVSHADDEKAENQAKRFTATKLLELLKAKNRALLQSGLEKLYLCAEEGTALDMDAPLINLGGLTAREAVERLAFSHYETLHIRPLGVTARATFALAYTSVGEDVQQCDLLENIDSGALLYYALPTPTPVPTPVPTDTPRPTATPAPTESPEEQPVDREPPSGLTSYSWGIPALGLVLSAGLFFILFRKPVKRCQLKARIVLSLVPLIAGLAGFALLVLWPRLFPAAAPAPTPAPTPEPTVIITPLPEPEATEEPPIPEPEPKGPDGAAQADEADAEYFRQEGDPPEVIVADIVNGYWEYKTDALSIIINRFVTTYTTLAGNTYPQVYFVAEIRMRGVNAFRTGQSAERRNGLGAVLPYVLARQERSVLLITGDNLILNDKAVKGILIRGGKFIGDFRVADTMAMYPDMTLRVFRPQETNKDELLADGVRDAISFGPTLMREGRILQGVDKVRDLGDERNPRTGIGMVSPGHFIAIVADGRQKEDYSHGMSLSKFAELFVPYGCVEVYNLDGGVSAAMIFMGEQINRHADRANGTGYGISFQRRIPDGLIWGYSTLVPAVSDPVYNRGTNKDGQNLLPSPAP